MRSVSSHAKEAEGSIGQHCMNMMILKGRLNKVAIMCTIIVVEILIGIYVVCVEALVGLSSAKMGLKPLPPEALGTSMQRPCNKESMWCSCRIHITYRDTLYTHTSAVLPLEDICHSEREREMFATKQWYVDTAQISC